MVIFNNLKPNIALVGSKFVVLFKDTDVKSKNLKARILKGPAFNYSIPWIYFDGAIQDQSSLSNAGKAIHISHSKSLFLNLGICQGTNTWERLMALWGHLISANSLSLDKLQIIGDSKIIVN
jgi:hypothetical protein